MRSQIARIGGMLSVLMIAAALPGFGQGDPETRRAYTLYFENFKNENYKDAIPDLTWILYNQPGFFRDNDTNFDRAIELYQALANAEEDPAQKRAYLDSALVHFDRVVPVLQSVEAEVDPFIWTRNKGRFIQNNLAALGDLRGDMVAAYRATFEMDYTRVNPYYLDVIIDDRYKEGDIGGALAFLRELKEKRGEEAEIDNLIRKYFVVIPPDEQIAFLEEQYEAEPDNEEVITQLFELYQQEAYREEMLALAPKVLAMTPNASTLRLLMKMYVEDADNEQALMLFAELQGLPDVDLRAEDYYNAGLAHLDQEDFRAARNQFRQALDADPEFTPAQVAIPNLYATAASTCGISDREQAAVFWIIADEYARLGDQESARRMATAFPTAEDVFYVERWTVGENTQVSYTCRGLTISGTTRVRQR